MFLPSTAATELVEGTLGHLGEDHVHGIVAGTQLLLAEFDHVCPILGELVAQESVGTEGKAGCSVSWKSYKLPFIMFFSSCPHSSSFCVY